MPNMDSVQLNPFKRCAPVLVQAKKSEKIEITYFWPEMTYVRKNWLLNSKTAFLL